MSDLELRGDVRLRAIRIVPRLTETSRFSHLTAAELQHLRLPAHAASTALHVTGRDAVRGVRRLGVVGHRSRRAITPSLVDGLPCSDPITAWCECSELLPLDDLIVMADGLLRRRAPLATFVQLEDAVAARQGARGVRTLQRALAETRAGTDSATETALRLLLVRAGFPEPVINGPLLDHDDRFLGYGDLVWPAHRIVVEYEGRQHAEDRAQFAIDIRRIDRILEAGYRHIRVDSVLLRDRTRLVRTLTTAFLAHPPVRLPRGGQ